MEGRSWGDLMMPIHNVDAQRGAISIQASLSRSSTYRIGV